MFQYNANVRRCDPGIGVKAAQTGLRAGLTLGGFQ